MFDSINDILDAAKEAIRQRTPSGLVSDRMVAAAIGVSEITRYRKNKALPDDFTAIKIAELAGLDPRQVLVFIHLKRAERGEVVNVWQSVFDDVQGRKSS